MRSRTGQLDERGRGLALGAAVGTLVVAVYVTSSSLAFPLHSSHAADAPFPLFTQPKDRYRTPSPKPTALQRHPGTLSGPLNWLLTTGLVLIAAALLAVVVTAFVWRQRRSRFPNPTPTFDEEQGALAAITLSRTSVEAARAALQTYRYGDPRNAIVACWMHLEDACAADGRPRLAPETSVEFTRRVLQEGSEDPHAVDRLSRLYREARFSEHPMSEADRSRALDLLNRTVVGLRLGDEVPVASAPTAPARTDGTT